MIQSALVIALVYYLACILDNALAWDATWRPLFVASITGWALGDLQTGLIMGASLEAIYMGISAIGGVIPSDPCSASILSVAFVILTGADMNLALALALPIGTIMTYVSTLLSPLGLACIALYEKFAAEGNEKAYKALHYFNFFILSSVPRTIVMFLAVAFGVENLEALTKILPEFVMNGLNVSGGMLVAVGFGILTSMIWSKELGIFFFIGFALVTFFELPIIGVAIFAFAAAYITMNGDMKLKKMEEKLALNSVKEKSKEDFF